MGNHRLQWVPLLCCAGLAICSCGRELGLSNSEALELVKQARPPERVNGVVVLADTPEALKAASELISKNLLTEVGALSNFAAAAGIREEEGATVNRNSYSQKLEFRCPLFTRAPFEVTEVLVDRQNETALVTFATTLQPFEPYYSTLCVKNRPLQPVDAPPAKRLQQISLKHYDKGWRVLGE
jgi:hypothetical protein